MLICQGKFNIVSGINRLYNGKYMNQIDPTMSKYHLNYDNN